MACLKVDTAPRLLLSGLDSLYVSFNLDTATSLVDWAELAYLKESLRVERGEFTEIELGSEQFALMPYGRKPYTYILTNACFEVRLAEHMQPACHVQFFSEALWGQGLANLTDRFERWHRSMNLLPIRPDLVGRADWSFDYHLPTVDFETNWFVSRATKDAIYRENGIVQTFTFGRGDVVVRIYDKTAEIAQQSGKTWFFALWGTNADVWRIEFQVRGPRLREGGIRSIADLQDLGADLLRELASSHTTLRAPRTDLNRSRWPLHPLWTQLLLDIDELPQTGLVRDMDRSAPLEWRLHRQVQSLYGMFKGIAAILALLRAEGVQMELEDLLEALPGLLDEHHSNTLWRADIEWRIKAHGFGRW